MENRIDRIEVSKPAMFLYLMIAYLCGAILSWFGLLIIGIISGIYYYQKEKDKDKKK